MAPCIADMQMAMKASAIMALAMASAVKRGMVNQAKIWSGISVCFSGVVYLSERYLSAFPSFGDE